MLTPEIQAEILIRHIREGHSARKIAKNLGVNRKSVALILERRSVKERKERSKRALMLDDFAPQILQLWLKTASIGGRHHAKATRKWLYRLDPSLIF